MIIDLYFLILAVIAQIFIPIAELTIPVGTQANEANAEIETQPLIAFYLTDLYLKLTKTSRIYIAGNLHKNIATQNIMRAN